MICQRKQIQARKLTQNFRTIPHPSYQTLNIFTKNNPQNPKDEFSHEKSYEIVPWHIKSNSKLQDLNFKFSNQLFSSTVNHARKFNSLIKNTDLTPQKTNLDSVPLQKELEVTKIIGSPFINLEETGSPAKIDMLECSMRFEQYEQQKAQEIKSIFMSKIITAEDKKLNQKESQQTNFIKRNIETAFELQNGKSDRFTMIQRKRTIEETKQQLILNRQKLQQESKQIFKVISMKDEKLNQRPRPKSQTQNRSSNFQSSFWNLSYVEKGSNPDARTSRKNHSTITEWKKVLMKRSKSQNPKQLGSTVQNVPKNAQNSGEKESSEKKVPQNQHSRSLSKKLARIWKVKNKQTLVIPSASEIMSNSQRLSESETYFHSRIHSGNIKRDESKDMRKWQKHQNPSIEHENFTEFENMAISKLFGVKSERISRKALKSEVFTQSARKDSSRNFPQRQKGRKIMPQSQQKRLTPTNFCISGNTYQMGHLYPN